jgi:hypothetical protein
VQRRRPNGGLLVETEGRPEVESGQSRAGVDRRTLIKRAAAAGAVAWSAPVIVDSLASPAAAVSNCTGTSPGTFTTADGNMGLVAFTPGPGVTSVTVQAWGAGGGGGGGSSVLGGGGGGGGSNVTSVVTVTPCTTYAIDVGMVGGGGMGGATGGMGGAGESSVFGTATFDAMGNFTGVGTALVTAPGGSAGNAAAGGAGGTGTLNGGAGVTVSSGNPGGGGGGSAGTSGNGQTGTGQTGGLGGTGGGVQGASGGAAQTKGGDGNAPGAGGGGGGGGTTQGNGGAGGDGQVIIS